MPGYKGIPASDPVEQDMRERWYDSEGRERELVGIELGNYIWNRTLAIVEEDRKRHPKKKRNLPVPSDVARRPGNRMLP